MWVFKCFLKLSEWLDASRVGCIWTIFLQSEFSNVFSRLDILHFKGIINIPKQSECNVNSYDNDIVPFCMLVSWLDKRGKITRLEQNGPLLFVILEILNAMDRPIVHWVSNIETRGFSTWEPTFCAVWGFFSTVNEEVGVGDVCFFLTMRCFNDAMFWTIFFNF